MGQLLTEEDRLLYKETVTEEARLETQSKLEPPKEVAHTAVKRREVVALDVDGTLFKWKKWEGITAIGELFEGAREFVEELKKDYDIIIHSCRVSDYLHDNIPLCEFVLKSHLKQYGIPFDEIWAGRGKPVADYYIDDKAVHCSPAKYHDAYPLVLTQLKNKLI